MINKITYAVVSENPSSPEGKPCLANVITNEYKKDGQTKRTMQVSTVTTWRDGVELSSDELESDVPF